MLHVTIGGTNYEVAFIHGDALVDDSGRPVPTVRSTVADIYIEDDAGRYLVTTGVATCHYLDNFCKATGRKLALTRALEVFAKPIRQAIWQAYWKAQGKNFAPRAE